MPWLCYLLPMPHFDFESAHAPARVCGVDEAGRGPWAGPVVAATVFFPQQRHAPKGLNDSKKLTAKSREALFAELQDCGAMLGVGIASVAEIDQLNIWGATSLAMRRAVLALPQTPDIALVDGKIIPKAFPCRAQAIVGGDALSLSIAAASIIAKVTRDRMMADLAQAYPHYGFERHAGYGTKQHQEALAAHGICPEHRRSYAPIRALLEAA